VSQLPLPVCREFGASGISVAPLAWGMWRLTERGRSISEAATLVHAALDAGIDLFDTADIYGFDGKEGFGTAEELLGAVLREEPGLRDRMVVATKGGVRPALPYDQSADYIASAIDASLRRLGVERIDLWQVHRPDILTHPHELARVLDNAVSAGKIATLGVSNFSIHQIAALQQCLGSKLVATQPEISPLRLACFENGELDQAMMLELVPLAWSPLGGGRLLAPQTLREQAVADALDRFATARGVSRSVAAYSWLMAHPAGIIPIVGSQVPARIAEAAQALPLTWHRSEWYDVLIAARGERLP
jgi:predicted oxidoreductase